MFHNSKIMNQSRLVPFVVASAVFMETLDATILGTSLPQIALSLDATPLQLSLAVTSYLLSLAVFVPISGWIADRFGARNVFSAAIAVFTLGSVLCGLSINLDMLVAARVLQGMGGAMMVPVGRLVLIRSFPRTDLVRVMNYMTIPATIGPTIGPLLGGFLTSYASWRWIFFINIPIGLLGIVFALRTLDDTRVGKPPAFDQRGFLLLAAGLVSFQVGVEYLGHHELSWRIGTSLVAASLAVLLLFRRYARRRTNPVVDLALFRNRCFAAAVVGGSCCRLGLGAVPFLLPLLLQLGFGFSAMRSGLTTFVLALGAIAMKLAGSYFLRTFGFRQLLVVNGLLVGGLIAGIAGIDAQTAYPWVVGYLLMLGFFRSLQFTALNTLGYADMPNENISRATSISSVAQQMSIGTGVAVGAGLLQMAAGQAPVTAGAFKLTFVAVGLIVVLASIGFLRLRADDGGTVSGHRAS